MRFIISCFVCIFLFSCSKIKTEELAKYRWKYSSGDFHVFDMTTIGLKNDTSECAQGVLWMTDDTLYQGEAPIALITGTEDFMMPHIRLYLSSIDRKKNSIYVSKGIFKKQ